MGSLFDFLEILVTLSDTPCESWKGCFTTIVITAIITLILMVLHSWLLP